MGCKPPSAPPRRLCFSPGLTLGGGTQEGGVITCSSPSSASSWEAIKMMEFVVEVLEKLSRKRWTKAEHGVWRVLMWKDQHFLSKNNRGGLSPGCTGWRQGALGLKMQPPELSCQEWNLAPVTRSPCDRGHVIYRLCVSVSFSAE